MFFYYQFISLLQYSGNRGHRALMNTVHEQFKEQDQSGFCRLYFNILYEYSDNKFIKKKRT